MDVGKCETGTIRQTRHENSALKIKDPNASNLHFKKGLMHGVPYNEAKYLQYPYALPHLGDQHLTSLEFV